MLPKVTLLGGSMETHFPDITAPVGIDSFSKFDEHGTRAGEIFQVTLTIGMDTKRSIRELPFFRSSRS